MPRDLFGDVTRPSISVGNRKWYTVPVSLLSHAMILAIIVVAPILAAPYLPSVMDGGMPDYIPIVTPPTPPLPPEISEVRPPATDHNLAPIVAPTGITDEPEVIVDAPTTTVSIVDGIGDINRDLPPPPPPAVKPEPQKPVVIGGTIRRPIKIGGSDPVYPAVAQAARIQGIVIIEATLSADGRVMNARLLRSLPMLDQAALDAVRTWEYTPTMLNGVAVPVIMTVTVNFTLSK